MPFFEIELRREDTVFVEAAGSDEARDKAENGDWEVRHDMGAECLRTFEIDRIPADINDTPKRIK